MVEVDSLTDNPCCAWGRLKRSRVCDDLAPSDLILANGVKDKRFLRVVCISDTHNSLGKMIENIPNGDVLIHAGDFTSRGGIGEVAKFARDFASLHHKHKIVIAGNHELSFDPVQARQEALFQRDLNKQGISNVRELLSNFTYLEDSEVVIGGYKFYGSPWTPRFLSWAFNATRGKQCLSIWNKIPDDTDILITHGPPIGHGDLTVTGLRAGCVELLNTIDQRVKPIYHIFGHIHENYGITTNNVTKFINASICTIRYRPTNDPIVFDLPLYRGSKPTGLENEFDNLNLDD